jgi:hypothetical protein
MALNFNDAIYYTSNEKLKKSLRQTLQNFANSIELKGGIRGASLKTVLFEVKKVYRDRQNRLTIQTNVTPKPQPKVVAPAPVKTKLTDRILDEWYDNLSDEAYAKMVADGRIQIQDQKSTEVEKWQSVVNGIESTARAEKQFYGRTFMYDPKQHQEAIKQLEAAKKELAERPMREAAEREAKKKRELEEKKKRELEERRRKQETEDIEFATAWTQVNRKKR